MTEKQIAQFLRHHLDTVRSRQLPVKMDVVVSEWDAQHKCGTVCCMAGWLPVTYPDRFEWNREYRTQGVFEIGADNSVLFGIEGIPVELTDYLFGCEDASAELIFRYGYLGAEASPERTFEVWDEVIADLENGTLKLEDI